MTIPYTYLIKHKESEKLYHGSRTAKNCNPDELLKEGGYKTSSRVVKDIINREGLDAFEIINIEIFHDTKEARLAEENYHKEYDVEGNVSYFNRHNAGGKFCCISHSEETRKKMGSPGNQHMLGKKHTEETKEKFKYRKYSSGENHYMYGKNRSEESKKKTSNTLKRKYIDKKGYWFGKSGEGTPHYGKKHSEETKKIISEKNKGKTKGDKHPNYGKSLSDETREKLSKSMTGKRVGPKHHNYGKPGTFTGMSHSEESKNKIREANKGQHDKIACPHCVKVGGVRSMKRWHFDNCKYKNSKAA